MSFPCPACGASARTRSRSLEEHEQNIYKTYYQCSNIECGACFCTPESFVRITKRRKLKTS
ncbi:ogr/Delta-like zinc finger family protein [Escherichia coli]|uniref:ogr/Delta-like zinc finger family protein n=1 Tax=Escherichia coli TaxID=562 RepID=UPI001C28D1B7|nr:ogr/Delta-like zinc finger family protein [Escherichia coli]MEA0468123.1 ogr/Delta-like zinc finger family protein [Escherichia coli]HBH4795902.1 ogr/Delta-like zinc finger family protein [Escherichia coli]